MPILKFVTACEKTIIDANGPVSLISLFQRMSVKLQDAPMPEKAIVPNQWSIFCLWENDPKEVGQEFVQVMRAFAPDGTVWVESEQPFKNMDASDFQSKITIQTAGIPVWQEGVMEIKVWLKGDDTVRGSYRFAISYLPKEDNANNIPQTI